MVTHDAGSRRRDQIVPFYSLVVPQPDTSGGENPRHWARRWGSSWGAKLARPDWLAVNLMGDAAFRDGRHGFRAAVRNRIPKLTILMNNGVMGGYTKKQPIATELFGIHRLSGHYAKVAEALGGYGERVEKTAELKPALQRAISIAEETGNPAFLEVITAEEPDFPCGK